MRILFLMCLAFTGSDSAAQINFSFNFANFGQRVCPADVTVNLTAPAVRINFLDASVNTTQSTDVYRRPLYGTTWNLVAGGIVPGSASWTDNNVAAGEIWEYQIKRTHGTSFSTGYAVASVGHDQSGYRGRMILLAASNITNGLALRYRELKKDLTGDGWLVEELIVPKAFGWNSGDTVVTIREQLQAMFNAAPANDKPKLLFILGHVPVPRSGLGGQTPDGHIQNAGARGADTYYADLDGTFTDLGTYNPGGLSTPLAVNLPGDFKWDQDIIPSGLEMGFGRIDFADVTSYTQTELFLTDRYLARLHNYRHVSTGFQMGNKTGFYLGYDNSNDGSYRSLPGIGGANNVYQNTTALPHPQWVQQNGPFMIYMQNIVAPQVNEWNTYGMNAAIYSSDQSYWGFGDVPEANQYSKIRSILGADSKCVMAIWTTTAVNIFHQAGAGEAIGVACRPIMDHNSTNQKLEKPSSAYDTPAWWNRTHFVLWGDPSIRLHQVIPAANPLISGGGTIATLQWTPSPDNNIIGYHIYRSATELGKFEKISGNMPVANTTFTDNNAHFGDWYMIRAIKQQQTGSGIFLNPANGIFIKNELTVLPLRLLDFTARSEKQTALLNWVSADETNNTGFYVQRSADAFSWADLAFLRSNIGAGNARQHYQYRDVQPLRDRNFYRLKSVSTGGDFSFSEVKKVSFENQGDIIVYPNPLTESLQIISDPNHPIQTVTIFNSAGKKVYERLGNVSRIEMKTLPAGNYLLRVATASESVFTKQFIKSSSR